MALQLETPSEFTAFPFQPYNIQLDLMQQIYSTIEARKVAILESPTGTGKTLSLLCGSLTWLKDEKDRAKKGKLNAVGENCSEPDWVVVQALERQKRELEADEQEYARRLAQARKREAQLRKAARGHVRKRPRLEKEDTQDDDGDDEAAFLPDSEKDGERTNLSPAVLALMRKLEQASRPRDEVEEVLSCTKIYYASRTHSQLAQVLHELQKLNLRLNVAVAPDPEPQIPATKHSLKRPISDATSEEVLDNVATGARAVSLGSRKQLCINETLRKKATDLDEACRQMLGEKGKNRCPHLPTQEDEIQMLDLRDQILATPKDIEELVLVGQESDTCPYFGSRRAIPQAQLVLLPYNLLLQKNAREALGIDLTDQVVVIDEAHNLISTLLSLSTTRLPLRTLSTCRHQLSIYLARFRTRLSTVHLLHLKRLTVLLDALARFSEEWRDAQVAAAAQAGGKAQPKDKVEVMTSANLLSRLGRKTEGVNLLEIEKYLRESKIARKISGYSVKAMEKAAGQDKVKLAKLERLSSTTPPLHAVESFIAALTAASEDGRVVFTLADNQVEIKYQHLNPATHFQEIVSTARSVILAGGTMSPISDVVAQLFTGLPSDRLGTFSCGHIIPADNLRTLVLQKGPRGGDLQFKFQQRGDEGLMAELGQTLLNFATIVPAGMVVFVPSYAFLNTVTAQWRASGLLEKLNAKKKVFSEPQDSGQVEAVLRAYAAEIATTDASNPPPDPPAKKRGALLFAVVGAKLSEGLNFSDDLARAVIIVGLPFANLASPELRERMAYVSRASKAAGTELYENMCMNAVNQSIGRAIRHRGDWAALVLVDARYASARIRGKLPGWIAERTRVAESFGQAMKEMGQFYREKRAVA